MTIRNGLLHEARWVASPNFGPRPLTDDISLLVIHNISLPPGQFGSGDIERFFRNQLDKSAHPYFETIAELKVSSHLLIERDGTVIQFVNFNDRAWHAGASEFCGRDNCNDYSIGIELEGTDDTPYTAEQYHVLADITASLLKEYPALTEDRITGHNNIAPGRKTDPGPAFDWLRYRSEVTAFIEEQA
ncbi:MAG: 1,6-anhydro-N-acetylmuramyl-L-alanine amidase AmpD [Thalassolituus sp.]|jgi:AmpD protein|tara:strand:- start:644 stop:1207 length:564 start_codon:yes stop_codon:yes gene_type:complete